MIITDILGVEIPLHPGICQDETNTRIEQEEAAYLSKIAFLKGKITLEEYLDILEMCEVDMDDYLLNLEGNLKTVGIII